MEGLQAQPELPYTTRLSEVLTACVAIVDRGFAVPDYGEIAGSAGMTEDGSLMLRAEGTNEERYSDACSALRYGIAVCTEPRPSVPNTLLTEPSRVYTFIDRSVYTSTGRMRVHEIRKFDEGSADDDTELVTITVVSLAATPTKGQLYACILSKDGQPSSVEIIEHTAEDQKVAMRCLGVFGDDSLTYGLLRGDFTDEVELRDKLVEIWTQMVEMNKYQPEEVGALLHDIQEVALRVRNDRDNNHGLRWRRTYRLLEFLREL